MSRKIAIIAGTALYIAARIALFFGQLWFIIWLFKGMDGRYFWELGRYAG